MEPESLLGLTAGIVSAFLGHNRLTAESLPNLIQSVHRALATAETAQPETVAPSPAVSLRSSVKRDHIVCLEDGLKFKSMRRHLTSSHRLTPEAYRVRWGLPADYPMVAPVYAALRSEMAKNIGLGMRRSDPAEAAASNPVDPRRGKAASKPEPDLASAAAREPLAARAVVSSEEAVKFSEPPAPSTPARRREPAAASVFAKFEADDTDEHGSRPQTDAKAFADVGAKRKPFAKQSARGMRSGKRSGQR